MLWWIVILLLFLAAISFLLLTTRPSGYEMLVQRHYSFLDRFFTWFTFLGDGIFILLLVLIFFLRKNKFAAVNILFSYALSGLAVQVLKNLFPFPRPAVLFREAGKEFYAIPGVTLMNSNASFPSGHTASAFALMATLLLLYPASKWNPLWIALAAAVGYSRIYLGNHFLVDVTAGALIGTVSAFISLLLTTRLFNLGKWKYFSWQDHKNEGPR